MESQKHQKSATGSRGKPNPALTAPPPNPEPFTRKTQNMIHYDSLHLGSDDISHLFAQIVFLFPLCSSPPLIIMGFGILGELKLISFGEFLQP